MTAPDPRLRELHVRVASALRGIDSLRRDLEAASELLQQLEEDAAREEPENLDAPPLPPPGWCRG